MSSRSIQVVACVRISFLFVANDIPLFIHPSIHEHLDCFHLLAIMDNAAMNIGESFLSIFLCIFYDRIAESDNNTALLF